MGTPGYSIKQMVFLWKITSRKMDDDWGTPMTSWKPPYFTRLKSLAIIPRSPSTVWLVWDKSFHSHSRPQWGRSARLPFMAFFSGLEASEPWPRYIQRYNPYDICMKTSTWVVLFGTMLGGRFGILSIWIYIAEFWKPCTSQARPWHVYYLHTCLHVCIYIYVYTKIWYWYIDISRSMTSNLSLSIKVPNPYYPSVAAATASKTGSILDVQTARKSQKWTSKYVWLVVWTPLKNISQLGWLVPIYGKIKKVPNYQPDVMFSKSVGIWPPNMVEHMC